MSVMPRMDCKHWTRQRNHSASVTDNKGSYHKALHCIESSSVNYFFYLEAVDGLGDSVKGCYVMSRYDVMWLRNSFERQKEMAIQCTYFPSMESSCPPCRIMLNHSGL